MSLKTFIISANSLNELRCYQKWQYYKGMGIVLNAPKGLHMSQGDLLHKVLEYYYGDLKEYHDKGEQPSENLSLIENAIDRGRKYSIDKTGLDGDQVQEVMHNFKEYAIYRSGDNWKILGVEQPFTIELFNDGDFRILGEGKIDLIVEDQNGKRQIDHKGVWKQRIPSLLSNQNPFYCEATGLRQITINDIGFQTTLSAKERMQRHMLDYPDSWIAEWKVNTVHRCLDLIQKIQQNYFPKDFTACRTNFGNCSYTHLCEALPESREYKIQTMYKKVDPHDLYGKEE